MIPRQDEPPTLAELEADDRAPSIVDGMTQCRYGCPTWFHGNNTYAARSHYAGHETPVDRDQVDIFDALTPEATP